MTFNEGGRSVDDGDETGAPFAVIGALLLDGTFVDGAVVVERGRIISIERGPRRDDLPVRRMPAAFVAPGLIDLQVNGGFGVSVGNDPDALIHLAQELPRTGVTSFLPTAISAHAASYPGIFAAFATARDAPGARPLGLHLEGPFLSTARRGAHRQESIDAADAALFDDLLAQPDLRLMTVAPERPSAVDRIRRLRERGVVVSLGHSDATYEAFVAGANAGATMATHLFNAMSPFEHRQPGAIGASLVDDRLTVGLIADGVHSHPASLLLTLNAKGPARIALVTDMVSAAGMPPGRYELGGQQVESDGVSVRLDDGTLAGSVLTLDQAVRNVVAWTGTPAATALTLASEVPARVLGLKRIGRIEAGYQADLILFDPDLSVVATMVAGKTVYRRPASAD